MKILIVTMSLPYPPASGGAIRVHGIVEGLHQAGHSVTVMCFHAGERPAAVNPAIRIETAPPPSRRISDRLRDLLLSRQPDIARRFYDETFADRLDALCRAEQFDVVQFEGIEAVCYLPTVQAAQPDAKRIFDTFNAEYDLQRTIFHIDRRTPRRWPAALYSYLQIGRIRRYEAAMCHAADAVIAVSPEDVRLLEPLSRPGSVHWVPNGIWVDRYITPTESPFTARRPQIVFTGKMDYRPNVDAMLWFTESILPRLDNVHLTIVGQQPHPRLAHLHAQPDVTITGWVESVLPYLQHGDVYVAPLRMGSGTRLKLLEAMASSARIVATSTAAAGLDATVRDTLHLADTAEDFAQAIRAVLADETPAEQTSREIVRQTYDWGALIPRLLAVYRQLGLGVTV